MVNLFQWDRVKINNEIERDDTNAANIIRQVVAKSK